jgi:hypothetical protein
MGAGLTVRTRKHKAVWLRFGAAVALLGYLVLLFYAHVHVMLETHEHGEAHAEHHDPDSNHDHEHDHAPHPADDHNLAASTPALGKAEQVLVHDLVLVVELVLAPAEVAEPPFGWIEDRPKHPPPRLPEQPRSPPPA